MRKERSLDRSSATENFLENLGFVTNISNSTNTNSNARRSYASNSSQPTTPQHLPSYANSTLYLNSNTPINNQANVQQTPTTSSRIHRPHQRSNSILNGTNQLNLLNPLNFTRDYGTSVSVGGGLRASARAQSTNSFSINNLQRETSGNSIKSMLNTNTNDLFSNQQQQQQSSQQTSPSNQTQVSNSKLNFIKDLQIRLMDLQKECYFLRCELDTNQQKLTSSMQSIKQFWSPELKRERQQRKEETAKYTVLLEQYKLLQSQYQTLLETYEQQSIQLQQTQIQMQQLHQHEDFSLNNSASAKQALKEKTLLKKTISELEMRINAQKQSLNTKDETIKKLFQMIKTISNKNNDLSSSVNNKIDTVRIRIVHVLFSISLCLI